MEKRYVHSIFYWNKIFLTVAYFLQKCNYSMTHILSKNIYRLVYRLSNWSTQYAIYWYLTKYYMLWSSYHFDRSQYFFIVVIMIYINKRWHYSNIKKWLLFMRIVINITLYRFFISPMLWRVRWSLGHNKTAKTEQNNYQ